MRTYPGTYVTAVSYTHLDVYKRQAYGIQLLFVILMIEAIGIKEFTAQFIGIIIYGPRRHGMDEQHSVKVGQFHSASHQHDAADYLDKELGTVAHTDKAVSYTHLEGMEDGGNQRHPV